MSYHGLFQLERITRLGKLSTPEVGLWDLREWKEKILHLGMFQFSRLDSMAPLTTQSTARHRPPGSVDGGASKRVSIIDKSLWKH